MNKLLYGNDEVEDPRAEFEKVMDKFTLNFDTEMKQRLKVYDLLRQLGRDNEGIFSPQMVPMAELEEKETQINNCYINRRAKVE